MPKVIDGLTGVEFASYEAYLAHTSPITGFKPTDPEHQGKKGLLIAKEALKRTNSLTAVAEARVDANMATAEAAKVQNKLNSNAHEINTRRGPKVNVEVMT